MSIKSIDQSGGSIYLGATPDLAVKDGDPGLLGQAEPLPGLHPPVARDWAPQRPVLGDFRIHALKLIFILFSHFYFSKEKVIFAILNCTVVLTADYNQNNNKEQR